MQATKLSSCQSLGRAPFIAACNVPQRPKRRPLQPVSAFGPLDTAADTVGVLSQVITTAAVAVGAWYMLGKEVAYLEQDKLDQSMSSEPCPRCNGVGYEPCMCTRWSDGDAGCSTCAKSGYMPCRSCRGGGTAIPLLATVRKERQQ